MTAIEIVISIFLLIGVFFSLFSGFGLIRLPDVYTRTHAGGKSSTLGVMSIMIATFLYFLTEGTFNAKVLLAIFFIFLTAPLSALFVNRSAYRTNVPLSDKSKQDDLKEYYKKKQNSI